MDMFDKVIAREGGEKITNISGDPGGVTKYGISQRSFPRLDIATLTYEDAKKIYQEEFFTKHGLNFLPIFIQEQVLDFAVHSGPVTAIRYLQKVLGLKQDGVIGKDTVQATMTDPLAIMLSYQRERCLFLAKQVVNKPEKLKFLVGWLNRVLSL